MAAAPQSAGKEPLHRAANAVMRGGEKNVLAVAGGTDGDQTLRLVPLRA